MALIFLAFDNVNVSAQVGDTVYYHTNGDDIGGFDSTALENTIIFGVIDSILENGITVQYDAAINPPEATDYISFVKDKKINTSSLIGYCAVANFVNNSKKEAEKISDGSEVVESSKKIKMKNGKRIRKFIK